MDDAPPVNCTDIYGKFWHSGLHGSERQIDPGPIYIWQLFFVDGEMQNKGVVMQRKEPEVELCNSINANIDMYVKAKFNLVVFSNYSPEKHACTYIVENLAQRLMSFQWCFSSLYNIKRPSCDFHEKAYMHNIRPARSDDNIFGLKLLVANNVKLTTFENQTWIFFRGFLQLACVLPNCLGTTYERTSKHNVVYIGGEHAYDMSRALEDTRMAEDLKAVLETGRQIKLTSVVDELPVENLELLRSAKQHRKVESAWSYRNRIFVKGHDGKRAEIKDYDSIDEILTALPTTEEESTDGK